MNRLIIVGNGFDLAHGLPTSYRDFINDYWASLASKFYNSESLYNDELIDVSLSFMRTAVVIAKQEIKEVKSFKDFKNFIDKYKTGHNPYQYEDKNACRLIFNNDFFKIINEKNSENWVDIENEYYDQLKKLVKLETQYFSLTKEYWFNEQKKKLEKLNSEFDEIKKLLENYLHNILKNNNLITRIKTQEFINIFEDNNYNKSTIEKLYKEFQNTDVKEFEKSINIEKQDHERKFFALEFKEEIKIENYFLSFNYTNTIPFYQQFLDYKSEKIIEIHGSLYNEENPINFGFGDEMDEDYKLIENINDNEYLKNIKSFQYLHTSNYKRLLDLIDSDKFQVYIMGHSCGLSDRTLLNTIFEHENCRSIKIYYHEKKNEKGKVTGDNYTEITQNISRHFNNKKLMREKIVNKTLCEPLPQIQLPKKV